VKALLTVSRNPHLLPPGHRHDGERLTAYASLAKQPPLESEPQLVAEELRGLLTTSVQERINGDEVGCWLSGGLDSSAMAALARPQVKTLHTFAAGLVGASDVRHAREVAEFIRSDHHEVIVSFGEMLAVLPEVIYHLESFDALLVRSSIINFLAGRVAAEHVPAVLSGEGGDELFAGYAYLKDLEPDGLADELVDITGRLHNTALQRVDRCSAAHGLLAYVPFLAPAVVDFALRIPVDFKLRDDIEKWIVRRAMTDLLPDGVLYRTKSKFWEGAGVGDLLARYAEDRISTRDFESERVLANGWRLRTKEELMYYRIFREQFGELDNLDWMGRTKGAPEV
jgi:asparagine synthase (glutamine-hydrolysing)